MTYRRRHDRHAPRSWMSLFIRLGGWGAVVLGTALITVTFISHLQLVLADRLDRNGAFAQAVIMDKRVQVRTNSDGEQERSYYATFRFKDSTTGGQNRERLVNSSYYDVITIEDEVTVRYLRDDPDTFEYEIGQYRRDGNVFRYVGLVLGLGGLFLLWRSGRKANAAILARRDGEKRFAEVTGITETSVKIKGKRQARLVWREPDGQTGESLMHPLETLSQRYAAGDKIVVFRLDDSAYWEGDVGPPKREMT